MPEPSRPSSEIEPTILDRAGDTPWAMVAAVVSLITFPLSLLSERGPLLFFAILTFATSIYWWLKIRGATYRATWRGPRAKVYSRTASLAWLSVPLLLLGVTIYLACVDITKLDLWRTEYEATSVRVAKFGPVSKFFGDLAPPRTNSQERSEFERAEWLRMFDIGARQTHAGSEVLFVQTAPFDKKYHTFILEVHDPDNLYVPVPSAVAMLVHDPPGDPWNRPVLRQVPCEFAGDGESRLFRVTVQSPNEAEFLQLLLCLKPTVSTAPKLDTLNLRLTVQP